MVHEDNLIIQIINKNNNKIHHKIKIEHKTSFLITYIQIMHIHKANYSGSVQMGYRIGKVFDGN